MFGDEYTEGNKRKDLRGVWVGGGAGFAEGGICSSTTFNQRLRRERARPHPPWVRAALSDGKRFRRLGGGASESGSRPGRPFLLLGGEGQDEGELFTPKAVIFLITNLRPPHLALTTADSNFFSFAPAERGGGHRSAMALPFARRYRLAKTFSKNSRFLAALAVTIAGVSPKAQHSTIDGPLKPAFLRTE